IKTKLAPVKWTAVDFENHVLGAITLAERHGAVDPAHRRNVKHVRRHVAVSEWPNRPGDRERRQVPSGVGQVEPGFAKPDADAVGHAPLALTQDERIVNRDEVVCEMDVSHTSP